MIMMYVHMRMISIYLLTFTTCTVLLSNFYACVLQQISSCYAYALCPANMRAQI